MNTNHGFFKFLNEECKSNNNRSFFQSHCGFVYLAHCNQNVFEQVIQFSKDKF